MDSNGSSIITAALPTGAAGRPHHSFVERRGRIVARRRRSRHGL